MWIMCIPWTFTAKCKRCDVWFVIHVFYEYVYFCFRPLNISTFWKTPDMEGNTGFYYVRSTPETMSLWAKTIAATSQYPKLDGIHLFSLFLCCLSLIFVACFLFFIDQSIFWKVIRDSSKFPHAKTIGTCHDIKSSSASLQPSRDEKEHVLNTCLLDPCLFGCGLLSRNIPVYTYEAFQSQWQQHNLSPVSLHANFMTGNFMKHLRMKQHNLWLLTDRSGDHKCQPYVPPASPFNFTAVEHIQIWLFVLLKPIYWVPFVICIAWLLFLVSLFSYVVCFLFLFVTNCSLLNGNNYWIANKNWVIWWDGW